MAHSGVVADAHITLDIVDLSRRGVDGRGALELPRRQEAKHDGRPQESG